MTYKLIRKGDTIATHKCKLPGWFRIRRFGVGAVIECSCGRKYKLDNSFDYATWEELTVWR